MPYSLQPLLAPVRLMRALRLLSLASFALSACASQPPARHAGSALPPTELVVDEATVVSVPRPEEPTGRVVELPPWPVPIETLSPALQCGARIAHALLHQPERRSVRYPEVCQSWSGENIHGWAPERPTALLMAMRALQASLQADEPQRDLTVALTALLLDAMLPLQLIAPSQAAADGGAQPAASAEIELHNGMLLHGATYTLRGCTAATRTPPDPGFAPWQALCASALEALESRLQAEPALAQALSRFQARVAQQAAGPRPPGPDACWAPGVHLPAEAALAVQGEPAIVVPVAPAAAVAPVPPAAAASKQARSKPCARTAAQELVLAAPWGQPPSQAEELAGPWPRDRRYGPRDPETGVRVSLTAFAERALDPRPLQAAELHGVLARCLQQDTDLAADATFSLQAQLRVTKTGQVRSVQLTDQPPEADAQAPRTPATPELARCVRKALSQLRFSCTDDDKPSLVRANVCLHKE